ncbi:MAG: hypothetical protein ABI577_06935 [bacterium]
MSLLHYSTIWRVFAVPFALFTAFALFSMAFATSISDTDGGVHTYGGYSCDYGGYTELYSAGGSGGGSVSIILTPACTNGYRELYTTALTTTNGHLYHYTGWVLYDVGWTFSNRSDLCQIGGTHRMSKSGVDTSAYVYTFVAGCWPV